MTCHVVLSLGVLKPLAEESGFGERGFFVFFKSIRSWAHNAKVTLCCPWLSMFYFAF